MRSKRNKLGLDASTVRSKGKGMVEGKCELKSTPTTTPKGGETK